MGVKIVLFGSLEIVCGIFYLIFDRWRKGFYVVFFGVEMLNIAVIVVNRVSENEHRIRPEFKVFGQNPIFLQRFPTYNRIFF